MQQPATLILLAAKAQQLQLPRSGLVVFEYGSVNFRLFVSCKDVSCKDVPCKDVSCMNAGAANDSKESDTQSVQQSAIQCC